MLILTALGMAVQNERDSDIPTTQHLRGTSGAYLQHRTIVSPF